MIAYLGVFLAGLLLGCVVGAVYVFAKAADVILSDVPAKLE